MEHSSTSEEVTSDEETDEEDRKLRQRYGRISQLLSYWCFSILLHILLFEYIYKNNNNLASELSEHRIL